LLAATYIKIRKCLGAPNKSDRQGLKNVEVTAKLILQPAYSKSLRTPQTVYFACITSEKKGYDDSRMRLKYAENLAYTPLNNAQKDRRSSLVSNLTSNET
jgi:hypothetical protein